MAVRQPFLFLLFVTSLSHLDATRTDDTKVTPRMYDPSDPPYIKQKHSIALTPYDREVVASHFCPRDGDKEATKKGANATNPSYR